MKCEKISVIKLIEDKLAKTTTIEKIKNNIKILFSKYATILFKILIPIIQNYITVNTRCKFNYNLTYVKFTIFHI